MPRRRRFCLMVLLPCIFALLPGCRGEDSVSGAREAPGGGLVTEEVAPPPDHLVDPTTDARETRRAPARVGGVMPGGFPDDLPFPEGSTLTDFGEEGGRHWVELTVPTPVAQVRRRHGAQLSAAGWEGRPGQGELRKGGRSVVVEHFAAGPSARVVIRY